MPCVAENADTISSLPTRKLNNKQTSIDILFDYVCRALIDIERMKIYFVFGLHVLSGAIQIEKDYFRFDFRKMYNLHCTQTFYNKMKFVFTYGKYFQLFEIEYQKMCKKSQFLIYFDLFQFSALTTQL